MQISIDFETFSECDIKTAGGYNYAAHSTTEVLCMAWAIDDEEPSLWLPDDVFPQRLIDAILGGAEVWAWNAAFERAVWEHWGTRNGMTYIQPHQWNDTAALAATLALPRALGQCAEVLGVSEQKNTRGRYLIQRLCQPYRGERRRDQHLLDELYDYCKQDVRTERAIKNLILPYKPMSDREREVWLLDQEINWRGLGIDVANVENAIDLIYQTAERLNAKAREISGGVLPDVGSRAKVMAWSRDRGYKLNGYDKNTVLEALADPELPDDVREVLEIRRTLGKASTSKYQAMLNLAGADGRAHGVFWYHGAQTGRWAGRGFQPQNLPRPAFGDTDNCIKLFRSRDPELLETLYGDPMVALSSCLRGMIVPAAGNRLLVSDFSAIEARVLAWLADEQGVLDTFREGGDIYCHAATGIYGRTITPKDKNERQIGKVAVLACLAGDTLVFTSNGLKAIAEVSTNDLLWDGVEWVRHDGVQENGARPTVNVAGINATPDHLFLAANKWREAQQLVSSGSTLSQALATGSESWSSLALSGGRQEDYYMWLSSVLAGQSLTGFAKPISAKAGQHAATPAPKNKLATGARTTTATQTSFQTTLIGGGCSTAYLLATTVATTPTTRSTRTTAPAEFTSSPLGAKTAALFFHTWSLLKGGMSRSLSLTGSMWTRGTSRATSASSQKAKTSATNGQSGQCSSASSTLRPVYDILNAGPRNRFLVLSEAGPLISHNCGYGGGVGAFQTMAKAYRVVVEDEAADQIKVKWRKAHPKIVRFWYDLETAAINAVRHRGHAFGAGPITFKCRGDFLFAKLPSGRRLAYYKPSIRTGKLDYWGTDSRLGGRWANLGTYGGKLAENVTQAVARDLLAEAMLRLEEHEYKVVASIHDEIICEMAIGDGYLADMEQLMCELPEWATGLPMDAEGFECERYRK